MTGTHRLILVVRLTLARHCQVTLPTLRKVLLTTQVLLFIRPLRRSPSLPRLIGGSHQPPILRLRGVLDQQVRVLERSRKQPPTVEFVALPERRPQLRSRLARRQIILRGAQVWKPRPKNWRQFDRRGRQQRPKLQFKIQLRLRPGLH